jgi:hypothetical protein
MARIETYNIDSKVTSNDTWIGSDGDKQNKTKNFSPIGLANYFNTSEGVHSANSIAFRYQTLKPEETREKGTISFKEDNSPTFNFSNISNILFSKFTLGKNEVDAFLLGLKDNTVILHRSGDINKYGLYRVLDVVEDQDEPQFLNFTLSFIQGNSYLQENEEYLFSLIDLYQDQNNTWREVFLGSYEEDNKFSYNALWNQELVVSDKENIMIVSNRLNMLKNDATLDELIMMGKFYQNLKEKQT